MRPVIASEPVIVVCLGTMYSMGARGRVVRVIDFVSLAPHCCGFKSLLHHLQVLILLCPPSKKRVYCFADVVGPQVQKIGKIQQEKGLML